MSKDFARYLENRPGFGFGEDSIFPRSFPCKIPLISWKAHRHWEGTEKAAFCPFDHRFPMGNGLFPMPKPCNDPDSIFSGRRRISTDGKAAFQTAENVQSPEKGIFFTPHV